MESLSLDCQLLKNFQGLLKHLWSIFLDVVCAFPPFSLSWSLHVWNVLCPVLLQVLESPAMSLCGVFPQAWG